MGAGHQGGRYVRGLSGRLWAVKSSKHFSLSLQGVCIYYTVPFAALEKVPAHERAVTGNLNTHAIRIRRRLFRYTPCQEARHQSVEPRPASGCATRSRKAPGTASHRRCVRKQSRAEGGHRARLRDRKGGAGKAAGHAATHAQARCRAMGVLAEKGIQGSHHGHRRHDSRIGASHGVRGHQGLCRQRYMVGFEACGSQGASLKMRQPKRGCRLLKVR